MLHALGGADDDLISAALGAPTDVAELTRSVPMTSVTDRGWATVHDLWAPALTRLLSNEERRGGRLRAATVARERGDYPRAVRLFGSAGALDEVRDVARRVCADSHPLVPAEVLSDWYELLVAGGYAESAEAALLAGATRKPGDPLGSVPFFELARTVTWQGEAIVIRPIRPEDEPQHRAFVESLQPNDLRLRFFSVRRELPRTELARLTQIDYAREMAFIANRTLADGTQQTLGVARAVIDPDNVDAEFAIIVRSDLKGRGLGHLLMRTLIDCLDQRGTRRLVCLVLRENLPMRRLALSQGFELDEAGSDIDALRFVLELTGSRRQAQGESP